MDPRAEMAAAAAQLRRMKKRFTVSTSAAPRSQAWKSLRRMIEGFAAALGASPASAGPLEADPARRLELAARARAAESRLEELAARQTALTEERRRAAAELETAASARLMEDALAGALDEAALDALLSRLQRLLAAAEGVLDEERAARQEQAAAEIAWERLRGDQFPSFSRRAEADDATLTVSTLGRLLDAVERRWRDARRDWEGGPGAAESAAALEGEKKARARAEERLRAAEEARDKAAGEAEVWKGLAEAARANMDAFLGPQPGAGETKL